MEWLFLEWIGFGFLGAFEFGKVASGEGVWMPLFLTLLYGLGGTVGSVILVVDAVRKRKRYRMIAMVAISFIGLFTAFLAMDASGNDRLSANMGLAAAAYSFLSLCISGLGLLATRKLRGEAKGDSFTSP